jgi:hypothetical protein
MRVRHLSIISTSTVAKEETHEQAHPVGRLLSVAIAGPMTGQYASAGDQIRKGAEMAIADINARGGVLGEKLKLEVGDDACDPKQAVSVANTMVNKGIVFMHGHWCSSSTIPASEVYVEADIPMATVSTNPQVTERGLKNIFRIMGRDDQQGLVAGSYIAEKFKGKKVAVVDDKSAYGKGLADEMAKAMEAKGLKPALRESITAGEKDYSGHRHQAQAGRRRGHGLRWLPHRGRADPAPGPGRRPAAHGDGRRHHDQLRARHRRRPRRRQRDVHVLARRAQEPGRGAGGGEVPRRQDRAGRLRALRLRRDAALRAGGHRPRAPSTPTSRRRCAAAPSRP